jgi:hypothetical protein
MAAMDKPRVIGTMRCDECNCMFVLMESDNRTEYEERLAAHLFMHQECLRATRSEAEGR